MLGNNQYNLSMQAQLLKIQKFLHDRGLYDVRVLALLVIVIITLSVFWNGAQIIQQNYELSLRVQEIERENEILELENRNKELRNQYYETEEFAELTARRVFGRAAPRERVYIISPETARNALTTLNESPDETDQIETQQTSWRTNFEKWMQIYFGS
jgi:cell division protein FtsB